MKKKRKATLCLKKFKVANLYVLTSILGGTNNGCGGDPGTDRNTREQCPNGPNPKPKLSYTCKNCPPVFTNSAFC